MLRPRARSPVSFSAARFKRASQRGAAKIVEVRAQRGGDLRAAMAREQGLRAPGAVQQPVERRNVGRARRAALARAVRPPSGLSSVLPQQRVAAAAVIAGFAHQQIEREAGEIVRDGLDAAVLLLIEDLAIRPARIAGLGADRVRTAFDRVIGNALRRLAVDCT